MSKRGHGSNLDDKSESAKQVKTKEEEESVAIRSVDEFVANVASLGGPELVIHLRRVMFRVLFFVCFFFFFFLFFVFLSFCFSRFFDRR